MKRGKSVTSIAPSRITKFLQSGNRSTVKLERMSRPADGLILYMKCRHIAKRTTKSAPQCGVDYILSLTINNPFHQRVSCSLVDHTGWGELKICTANATCQPT